MTKHLYLTGFMGAGKSTVGQKLARELQVPFVDLDQTIVDCAGRSIPEIFRDSGEATFRDLESACLQSLVAHEPSVIATGGGILGRVENRTFMNRTGIVVYLEADWETLKVRIGNPTGRPLARDADGWNETRNLWLSRLPVYELADVTVSTEKRSVQEIVDAIKSIAHA